MTHHASPTEPNESVRLNRRVSKNPFWQDAVRVLANHKLHLHKPAFGPSGGVHIQIYFQNERGNEVVEGIFLPATMQGLESLGFWRNRFEKNLMDIMRSKRLSPPDMGARDIMTSMISTPAEPNFVTRANTIVDEAEKYFNAPVKSSSTPPEVVEVTAREEAIVEEQLSQHEEFKETPAKEPVMEKNEQKVHVTISCEIDTLIALVGLHEGVMVDDKRPINVRLGMGISRLADFLNSISQSNAKLVNVSGIDSSSTTTPKSERVPNHQEMAYSVMTEGSHTTPIKVSEVKERIRRRFGVRLDGNQTSNALSLLSRKGRLQSRGKGIYSVA